MVVVLGHRLAGPVLVGRADLELLVAASELHAPTLPARAGAPHHGLSHGRGLTGRASTSSSRRSGGNRAGSNSAWTTRPCAGEVTEVDVGLGRGDAAATRTATVRSGPPRSDPEPVVDSATLERDPDPAELASLLLVGSTASSRARSVTCSPRDASCAGAAAPSGLGELGAAPEVVRDQAGVAPISAATCEPGAGNPPRARRRPTASATRGGVGRVGPGRHRDRVHSNVMHSGEAPCWRKGSGTRSCVPSAVAGGGVRAYTGSIAPTWLRGSPGPVHRRRGDRAGLPAAVRRTPRRRRRPDLLPLVGRRDGRRPPLPRVRHRERRLQGRRAGSARRRPPRRRPRAVTEMVA